jgi:teichuronic acid exporter
LDSTTHRNKTISGLKWNLIDQVYSQGLTFLLGIALMRLLNPEQFGLIGMVTVFSGFLNVYWVLCLQLFCFFQVVT